MTVLVLVRRDAGRVAAALARLAPQALVVVGVVDPLPPHELRLAARGLLGRSERGLAREPAVAAAGLEAARAAAAEVAAAASQHGFSVDGAPPIHPGPKELDALLARVAPSLVVVERSEQPLPPPLQRLSERGAVPVLLV